MNKHLGKIVARHATSDNLDNTCSWIQNPKIKICSIMFKNKFSI
jgi:hypothetical protein